MEWVRLVAIATVGRGDTKAPDMHRNVALSRKDMQGQLPCVSPLLIQFQPSTVV